MVIVIVTGCLPILLGAIDAFEASWGARHDPTWETRWRSLDPAERTWLAVMATSRGWIATLTDPEEIRLAKGRRRRESRRRLNFDLVALLLFLPALVLVLTGSLGAEVVALTGVFLIGLARNIFLYRRERQIKGALETQRRIAAGTATAATAS